MVVILPEGPCSNSIQDMAARSSRYRVVRRNICISAHGFVPSFHDLTSGFWSYDFGLDKVRMRFTSVTGIARCVGAIPAFTRAKGCRAHIGRKLGDCVVVPYLRVGHVN
jgi:hypothetical protein